MQRDFNEFLLHDHVLAVRMGLPGILQTEDFKYGRGLFWPELLQSKKEHPQWEFHCRTLEGAVIEALAIAWSVSLEEVLSVSDFSTDETSFNREIGLGNGKPVIETVDIIRNPKYSKYA